MVDMSEPENREPGAQADVESKPAEQAEPPPSPRSRRSPRSKGNPESPAESAEQAEPPEPAKQAEPPEPVEQAEPPEPAEPARRGSLAAAGPVYWLAFAVAALIALSLLWSAGEAHYRNCLSALELRTAGPNDGLARLVRNEGIKHCHRLPF